ncbi:hypothetical protein CDD82_5675 [Ophiocordyceps australis]|uniref:Uncharacterized protein n=1 Tax=Ophiocordyceps australis TaxID=1399860 RepID=A0A2C5XHY6_9HYPO|nr:hypothetical protein CDD82_5675 [Ophiocordyceps australis]
MTRGKKRPNFLQHCFSLKAQHGSPARVSHLLVHLCIPLRRRRTAWASLHFSASQMRVARAPLEVAKVSATYSWPYHVVAHRKPTRPSRCYPRLAQGRQPPHWPTVLGVASFIHGLDAALHFIRDAHLGRPIPVALVHDESDDESDGQLPAITRCCLGSWHIYYYGFVSTNRPFIHYAIYRVHVSKFPILQTALLVHDFKELKVMD